MPKGTKPGSSSSALTKSQQQRFRNAPTYIESGSEMNKSKPSEQTVSPTGTTTQSDSTPNQVEMTYNQLVSLGMPTDLISLTEFRRIYSPSSLPHSASASSTTINFSTLTNSTKSASKSKAKDSSVHSVSTLTQALDFICAHLVGRQVVQKRRALISQIVKEYSTRPSKLKGSSNFNKEPTLLNDPKQTAQALNSSARRTLDAVQREWDVINQDMQKLDIKHRTKKQELERAQRVLFLLDVLEKREEVRMRRICDIGHLVDDLRKEADLAMREFRRITGNSDGLKDREGEKRVMGNIRYRHTTETLAKLHSCHVRGQVNGVDRLDVVLGRLGVDDKDIKGKILQLVRKRTRERLDRLARVNQQKEKDVQLQINRVIALGFLSEGYLDCRLKEPDIQQQNGYIDQLRLAIIYKESSAIDFHPAKRMRAPERLAMPAITPQNTEHTVFPPFTSQINPNLSRKSDKSLLGFDIAADIDTLVKQSLKLK